MPRRLSAAFGVTHSAFDAVGAFDAMIDLDSQLHVDPHLLALSEQPEMRAAAVTLREYWRQTVLVLKNIFDHGDRFWRAAVRRFTFPENPSAGLGYSVSGKSGSAIGETLARSLVATAQQIVRAGVTDPELFELVGVLEDGIGADLISDTVIHVVEQHLLDYTERVSGQLGIATSPHSVRGLTHNLPTDSAGNYVIFFPKDVLRDLPIAFCWSNIDTVCAHNDELRSRMNSLIGTTWREAIEENSKDKLKEALIQNPAALADMIDQYRRKPGHSYDFIEDFLGESIWPELSEQYARQFPLDLASAGAVTSANVLEVVRAIVEHFRVLVECNGLSGMFWTDSGKVRHERFAQMLFFGIADAYCKANSLDLSPEVNSGRGPVDFKISSGYESRVLVEVKWSKNSKLLHGFEVQVGEYERAERTEASILLVIRVTATRDSVQRLLDAQGVALRAGKRTPEIKEVDGRRKDSASHFEADA